MAAQVRSLVDDMEIIHNNITGYLKLCPEIVQIVADEECRDKYAAETYRDYCERLQGSSFLDKNWKKLCSFSYDKFEKATNLSAMDLTALCHLFYVLASVKTKVFPVAFDKALKDLKELRNEVMHNISEARDPAALGKLETALDVFIQEAGKLYAFPAKKIQDLKDMVSKEIQGGFSPGMKGLLYAKASMIKDGWTTMKLFLQTMFEVEFLMFGNGKVERVSVFHDLEVLPRGDKNDEPIPYPKIFESPEKFIIVSGVAGSGKSTLLENIAIQFIKPQPSTSAQLQNFDLLVYIQCRDHTTQTLSQILVQQFPDVHAKLGNDMVLKAIFELPVLFLIDGYDEYSHPMTVLQEVVTKAKLANCQVIITTRPHSVDQLRQLLSRENINSAEFEIASLAKLDQQLNFLAKYEPHLPGPPPSGDVQDKFETLDEPITNLFTEPLRLLQFCYVYVARIEKINTWKNANDVAKANFTVYKDLVRKKLSNASYPDFDIVVDDLFLVICEAALTFLRKNIITFTGDQFKQVQRKCRSMLGSEHNIKDLDTQIVLSCVFKVRRPLTGKRDPIYSFSHKTDQEYFASRCVVYKIENSDVSLRKIIMGKESPTNNSFLEVLQYVVQDLGADSPELFEERWPELQEALQEAGADFVTWRNSVLNCKDDADVVERLAGAAKNNYDKWTADDGRDVEAIALMLPHAQPSLVELRLRPHALRKTGWAEILKSRTGDFRLDMDTYEACDDLTELLRNSNGRFTLEFFRGALSSSAGLTALNAAVSAATELHLKLVAPLQLSGQSVLLKECRSIDVRTTPLVVSSAGKGVLQLPTQPRARLLLDGVTSWLWEAVSNTVLTLAPLDGRFAALELRGVTNLKQEEVNRVFVALHRRSVRTEGRGYTHWDESKNKWLLHVTDHFPECLTDLRNLLDLRDHVMDLSACRPEQLQAEWPALRDELQAAGACWVDWQDLMLRCPSLEDLARLAAEETLAVKKDWVIQCSRDVAAVARMLHHARPRLLRVDTTPLQLRGNSLEVPRAIEEVPHPWEEVARLWDGELDLLLPRYTPCDDVLIPLRGSRAQLIRFRGGIAEDDSAEILSSIAAPKLDLTVHLLKPVSLEVLHGRGKWFVVWVRPPGSTSSGPWPLPAQPRPVLRITDVTRGSGKDVVHTVLSLAPSSNRYEKLIFDPCYLSGRNLDKTAAALQRRDIRTAGDGPTRWEKIRSIGSRLIITDKLPDRLATLP